SCRAGSRRSVPSLRQAARHPTHKRSASFSGGPMDLLAGLLSTVSYRSLACRESVGRPSTEWDDVLAKDRATSVEDSASSCSLRGDPSGLSFPLPTVRSVAYGPTSLPLARRSGRRLDCETVRPIPARYS